MTAAAGPLDVLAKACVEAGLDPARAQLVRRGENTIFRLPAEAVVVRIARHDHIDTAEREIRIARWLAEHDVPAVRPLDNITQPVLVDGRAVTFWEELPQHRPGSIVEIADALRVLHNLPRPDGLLSALDPFVRLPERIATASVLPEDDQAWLAAHMEELRERYRARPPGLPDTVVHGDAWAGNVVTTGDGRTVLLDLERCSIGPPEWDLVSIALRRASFGWLSAADAQAFSDRYGHDVSVWAGYNLLRDIRELRMALYRVQRAADDPAELGEALLRVASLRGQRGPRPWAWGR